MNVPVIAILRHADYEQPADVPSAWLPYPLTEDGIQQAQHAALLLRDFAQAHDLTLDPIVDASQMLRAWQTADIIRGELQLQSVEEFEALAERGVGAVANMTTREIETLLAADPRYDAPPTGWKSDTDYQLPFQGSESLLQAGERVARHIMRRESGMSPSQLKIIVGHGASLRHAAMHLGILNREHVGRVSMFHATPVFLVFEDGWQKVSGAWKPRNNNEVTDEFGAA